MIPSASNALPPMMVGTMSHFNLSRRTSVYRENIPPSPLLSARNVRMTYFTDVCSVSVQKMQEIPPSTTSASMTCLPTMAFITYSGDVPMSP